MSEFILDLQPLIDMYAIAKKTYVAKNEEVYAVWQELGEIM